MKLDAKLQWNVGYWLLALLALAFVQNLWQTSPTVDAVRYSAFEQALADGKMA
jgi:cell division protease FtsH